MRIPNSIFRASCFFFAALAAAAAVATTPKEKPVRVDFTSQPEEVSVFVDGTLRGSTPLTLFDIAPGQHHARFELKNYEPYDDFFTLQEGGYIVRNATLTPVKGLLLITTEPEGCSVSMEGLSLGTTPRLITTLDAKGVYRFTLQKAGYQSKSLEVRFTGRTPLVKHEKLILDSGGIVVSTTPAGAKVAVNGVSRGVTPLTVTGIPKGRTTLEISHDGYKPEKRELTLKAGEVQDIDIALEGIPGSIFLTSIPDGARLYINDKACGKAPVTIPDVKPGSYSIRAEMDGRGSVTKTVTVGLAQSVSEEFRLESILGRLEVKTVPADAQILIDGRLVGSTKQDGTSVTDPSAVFAIESLEAGEHVLTVRKDGFAEVVKHPVIENLRTTSTTIRLRRVFKPNVRLTTATGVYTGVFVDNSPSAVTIEVSMGITRSFPREDIRKIDFIGND